MKIKLTHKKTGYIAYVDNSGEELSITGNELIVIGLNNYFQSFVNTYYLPGQIDYAKETYGEDLLIKKDGKVYSIDTKSDKFLSVFFVKDMENMGYDTEICES